MTLAPGCPRCPSSVSDEGGTWRCADHGTVAPLWRPATADYVSFTEHLNRSADVPSLMPWPLAPGWTVTDFGFVAAEGHEARASFVACAGPSDADGVVELTVVSEEPGVGLGARIAGAPRTDPGADIGEGPPHVKVRIDGHPVSLWAVSTSDSDDEFDRYVMLGEAVGRWLWLVLRPASAMLLMRDEWILRDVSEIGAPLIELTFGGPPPVW